MTILRGHYGVLVLNSINIVILNKKCNFEFMEKLNSKIYKRCNRDLVLVGLDAVRFRALINIIRRRRPAQRFEY